MRWDDESRGAVDAALNEADVLGLRLGDGGAWCDLLLHVLALPEHGPLDPDARRILRLTRPGQVRVLLRTSPTGDAGYGPAIPLAGLDATEDFFASLSWAGSMYGGRFLDDPALTGDWPEVPSLVVDLRPDAGAHSLFWFSECGTSVAYCIEGTVTFEDLEVLRADGTAQPLDEFTGDSRRYWRALHDRDPRLSAEAQRAAQRGTPSWRPYARSAVTVSGTEP